MTDRIEYGQALRQPQWTDREGSFFRRWLLVAASQKPFDGLPIMSGNPEKHDRPGLFLPSLDIGHVALGHADGMGKLRLLGVESTKLTDSAPHRLPVHREMLGRMGP